jgi:hypothetical protein
MAASSLVVVLNALRLAGRVTPAPAGGAGPDVAAATPLPTSA